MTTSDLRIVLGIDAAWTERRASGIALIEARAGAWRLVSVQPSYRHFTEPGWSGRPGGGRPNVNALLDACVALCGAPPDLVAVDMPLSYEPIAARRVSDNEVSRRYATQGAGTHSPSAERPGWLAAHLRDSFAEHGYPLWTTAPSSARGLVEVYPHPALIELTGAEKRLPYKHAKTRAYWPRRDLAERKAALKATWDGIVSHLDHQIDGVAETLDGAPPGKTFEDMLDAVVCAWVGACVVEGRAVAHGDATSAIWIPAAAT